MFCGIGPDNLIADAAPFDPPHMLTIIFSLNLGRQSDEVVGFSQLLLVFLLLSLPVYVSDLLRHVFEDPHSPHPAVVPNVEDD